MKIPNQIYFVLYGELSISIHNWKQRKKCWLGDEAEQFYLSELKALEEAFEWINNQEPADLGASQIAQVQK